jgi:hypothetical protein
MTADKLRFYNKIKIKKIFFEIGIVIILNYILNFTPRTFGVQASETQKVRVVPCSHTSIYQIFDYFDIISITRVSGCIRMDPAITSKIFL